MDAAIPFETFESPVHAVLIVDGNARLRLCNQAAAVLLECPPEVSRRRPCWETVRLRTLSGEPFCGPACPLRKHTAPRARGRSDRLVLERSVGPVEIELLSFPIPGARDAPPGVLHLLLPERTTRASAAEAARNSAARRLSRLSPREKQILEMLGGGLDAEGIASRLCISTATVRNHVQHILHKLGVHRRLDAVIALLRGRR